MPPHLHHRHLPCYSPRGFAHGWFKALRLMWVLQGGDDEELGVLTPAFYISTAHLGIMVSNDSFHNQL